MHPTLQRIHQLAANEPDSHREKAPYHLYAYQLIPLIDEPEFATYIGETGKSVDQRYSEHVDGSRTCRPVRQGEYEVGPLLRDVMEALPSFKCRACVEQAEGLLADYFDETEGGAYSNNGQSALLRRNEQEAVNA